MAQLEQFSAGRSSGGLSGQHRVGGEQSREHDDVGKQEDPKSVADDDSHRRGPLTAASHRRSQSGELRRTNLRAHAGVAPCSRVRSAAANCSPDTSFSMRSIQPKATNVSEAQANPMIANHPICQISAKPVTTAKNAVTNPLGLLLGSSIDS